MNRKEWYAYWRQYRIDYPCPAPNFSAMLIKYYDLNLLEKDRVKLDLIDKYLEKVSCSLREEKTRLERLGRERAAQVWKELLYRENPFFKMMEEKEFNGRYLPVPLRYV